MWLGSVKSLAFLMSLDLVIGEVNWTRDLSHVMGFVMRLGCVVKLGFVMMLVNKVC